MLCSQTTVTSLVAFTCSRLHRAAFMTLIFTVMFFSNGMKTNLYSTVVAGVIDYVTLIGLPKTEINNLPVTAYF